MELEEAYAYQLNPKSYTESECADTNVSLQRRLGDDMDSCAFTHGTLMRACDIEERRPPTVDETRESMRAMQAQEQIEQAQELAQAQAQAQAQELARLTADDQTDVAWPNIFPSSMSSMYILLVAVIIVLLLFAMIRKRR
jgi:hypothetical protein